MPINGHITEEGLRRLFIRAFKDYGLTLAQAESRFAALLASGAIEDFMAALSLDGELTDAFAREVVAIYLAEGAVTVSSLRFPKAPYTGLEVRGYFGPSVPRAEAWTSKTVARLVTEVVEDQKAAIRQIVAQGIEDGVNPRSLIRLIIGERTPTGGRVGGVIGLTSGQAKMVYNARHELLTLDANYLTRSLRDRRFDAAFRKAVKEGTPLTSAQVDRAVSAYSDRVLRYRAEVVARTEYHAAVEAGKFDSVQGMIDSGKVAQHAVMLIWDATGDKRTRPDHMAMDGKAVPWGEPFVLPDGSKLRYPGDTELGASGAATIQCRCVGRVKINRYAGLT